MSIQPMTLADLEAKAHLIWQRQRDIRETSQRFRTCVALLGPTKPIVAIRTKDLDALKEALWRRPGIKSPQTINRYLAAVSKALRWAARRDEISAAPYIPREPGECFRLVYFTEAEEEAILRHFVSRGKHHIATLFRVLSVTGLRASEIVSLKLGDIDMGSIHIKTSKNGRDRFVPLEGPLAAALKTAIGAGLPSYRGLYKHLLRAKETLSIDKRKGLHVFRHTCATRLTRLGVPTVVVKDYLGHRSINTTMKYAHVEDATLRAAARLLDGSSNLTSLLTAVGRPAGSTRTSTFH